MVYYLSDNIISSLGFTTSENFEALKAGRVGIKIINDKALYPEPFPASVVDTQELNTRFSKLGGDGIFTRLEKLLILSVTDALQQSGIDIESERTGLILSTTKGNIDLLDKENRGGFEEERVLLWRLGEVIGGYFGNPNRVEVLSNACISGVVALNTAAMLIGSGKYDNVVVCGGDLVSRFVVSGFMSFLSFSPGPCKPFDEKRDGLSLGEAAGTIILSNKPKESRNIAWLGGASANDANHISGPSRTGEGSFIAIQKALKEAGLSSAEIDHISAHGTATPYNDEMESIAISRHGMESIQVNSLKGYWGHTLGTAGIIETAALAEEMRQNLLIGTAGFSKHGVSKPIRVVAKNEPARLDTCLKMASGFGGSNAALVLQKVSRQSAVGSQQSAVDSPTLQPSNPPSSQITAYCHIKNNAVYLNGEKLFNDSEAEGLKAFIKNAYRHFKPKYPKFFKMDEISKLGFLAAEVLLSGQDLENFPADEVAVVLSNSQSTLVTDSRFQESIRADEDFFPSPAVFVYTLPNIVIGEISIRHGLRGENAFFIFADFNSEFLTRYIDLLFASGKARASIGGWVDQSAGDFEAFLYLTEKKTAKNHADNHTAEQVKKLYNTIE